MNTAIATEAAQADANTMPGNRRILLVDDHRPIHDDYRSILTKEVASAQLLELESTFFGQAVIPSLVLPRYELCSAFQGQEAFAKVQESLQAEKPFATVFMDVRMPPGWDGIETIQRIWEIDPHLQVVICTAYADYSWEEIFRCFGDADDLVFLRKPFDHTEVRQLACALTSKWNYARLARARQSELEQMVVERTQALAQTVAQLTEALANVKTLSGLVPICAGCKKIRDDQGFWNQLEIYVADHTHAKFSHGICPDCIRKLYPDHAQAILDGLQ